MKIVKSIAYLCVTALAIAVVVFTKDTFSTLVVALAGYYIISNYESND